MIRVKKKDIINEQLAVIGPCLSISMTVWKLSGYSLKPGIVEELANDRVKINFGDTTEWLDPKRDLLFVKPKTLTEEKRQRKVILSQK